MDKANDRPQPEGPGSFDNYLVELHKTLLTHKAAVENFGNGLEMNPSDKKKLLALPFYLAKRRELPAPKAGQKEYALFTELTGNDWHKYDNVMFDPEEKINEFNYEKFISKHALKGMDTSSAEFKQLIKVLNFTTKTKYELHKEQQENFKQLMPLLRKLDEEETEIFLHLVRSKNRSMDAHHQRTLELIDSACDDSLKTQLAKISEDENFAAKNQYKLEKDRLQYIDKSKMPVSETKVRDLLRHQHIYRDKINSEIETYTRFQENTQFENGVLTYVNEGAWGDQRELLKDIGINNKTIQFMNVADLIKIKDEKVHDSDDMFENLKNSRFTMIDMTEYETAHSMPHELSEGLAFHHLSLLEPVMPEMWPQANALIEINPLEEMRKSGTSKTHRENQETRAAEAEAEEEEEEEEEEDEDEDEEGEEGEEGGEEEEEEDEEEEEGDDEDPNAIPKSYIPHIDLSQDRFFIHNEKLKKQFNDVELEAFMKLLNVRAVPQWQDETVHHHKVGLHRYEDESQMLDPYYHLLAEVERKHMEKQQVINFRRGTEVKFVLDPKKRPNFSGN